MRRLGIAIILSLFGASAFGQNSLPAIKWRTIDEGGQSQIKKGENRFLHTSGDLQSWWAKHSGQQAHTVPYKIDFNKEFAVAIHLGERKTGGYKVYVETVTRTRGASAIIAAVELQPGKGSITTDALTQPWVIVAIERPGVQDWQIKSRAIEYREPGSGGGGAGGCKCCEACIKSCRDVKFYNPTPLGIYSVDNSANIRALGAVPFLPVEIGDDSDIRRASSFVVQSERQFVDYWSKHHEGEAAPNTDFDWKREQLLAVHLGTAPTSGYKVHIVGIERTWYGVMNVQYAIEAPKPGDRIRRVATAPYAMVRMSRVTETINFLRRDDLLKNRCECTCKKCGCLH